MKDQYFGDKTDYIKHSLLRNLSSGSVPLAVHWNRTPDDGSTDGKHTSYLSNPSDWRHYDPILFDLIREKVTSGDRRLNHFQKFGLLGEAKFCYDNWTNDPDQRSRSNQTFLDSLAENSLVFYDPDNGLETRSVRPAARNSHKYVYLQDLNRAWQSRHSILLYQHYPRVSRQKYLGSLMAKISASLGCQQRIMAVSTSFAAFVCIPQANHMQEFRDALFLFASRWEPHVALYTEREPALGHAETVDVPLNSRQGELPL